jgi:hypothetical protein
MGQAQSIPGPQGDQGDTGKDGVGIESTDYLSGTNQLVLKKTDGTTFGPISLKGLNGKDGSSIKTASVTPEGMFSIETDAGIKFGPFNIKGPKGDTGAPGKDATIMTSNGIQYPGGRSDGVGYATDVWGNIVTPNNGPNTSGDNWNVSGKDGTVVNLYTDGSKKAVFSNDVITPHLYVPNRFDYKGRIVYIGDDNILRAHTKP